MPKLDKAYRRDEKRRKAQYGHKVDGKSVFVIKQEIDKRAKR